MALDRKIHEWLGKCWHERNPKSVEIGLRWVPCVHCRENLRAWDDQPNPAYTTDPAAMLSLIEAVRAKGYGFTMYADPGSQWHAFANSDPNNAYTIERADEGTLPMAVAKAVENLIDAETTTEAKDAGFKVAR